MTNKIFAFFAVLALAFAAQAETTTWANSFSTDGSVVKRPGSETETFHDQRVYVIYGALSVGDLWAYKTASMEGADASGLVNYFTEFYISPQGEGPLPDPVWGGVAGSHDFEIGVTPTYSLLMFDTEYDANARKYFLSGGIVPTDAYAEIDVTGFLAQASVADNWRALPVPEPTSGLLLLIGFAGLALKRRKV